MNIKLNWLRLSNFKGIKDFTLLAEGKNAFVFADNGKGKTTLMDGFLWLLFSKDSNDNTTFTVKPQDELGQDIHHLQTEVEAEMLIDGKPLKIKKMQEEKWVTKRGSDTAELTGNTASYWYDEVPQKATEYKEKIDSLINENIFKMITNPLYFNTKLKWEERRKILLEISGNRTDEEVIDSDESLTRLAEILKGRNIEDYKLVIADKLKGYKKERDNIPPRIDELTMSLPQEEPDYTEVEAELKKHKEVLAIIEGQLANATSEVNKITAKYQELAKLKNQLEETKQNIAKEHNSGKQDIANKHQELSSKAIVSNSNIQALESQIEAYKRQIEVNEKELVRLREEYTELSEIKQEILGQTHNLPEIETSCPTCNQKLPEETIKNTLEELKIKFEKAIEIRLQRANQEIGKNRVTGIDLKKATDNLKTEIAKLEKELVDKKEELQLIKIKISSAETVINEPVADIDYNLYPDYSQLLGKIQELQIEIDQPVEDRSTELLEKKTEIQNRIEILNKEINLKTVFIERKARIEELDLEEKRLSIKIAELEGHKFLLERFSTAKANLLEDSINIQFKHVRFKLFEENITNEGIKDTCIALVNTNGAYVKFEDANSAGRINAGIDVINALNKFYGVVAPIFTDNAESVTDLADTESQVIKLIKPEIRNEEDRKKYSQLVVEVE